MFLNPEQEYAIYGHLKSYYYCQSADDRDMLIPEHCREYMNDETARDGRMTYERSPSLAVIINCFNYEKYIKCAIDSVLSQNNRSCEIVVVDDGSTDNSWSIIQSSGVRAFRKDNGGQVSACLMGLDNTTAPFVLFLDADDKLLPNSLEKIMDALDGSVSKLQFQLMRINEKGSVIAPAFPALQAGRDRDKFKRFVSEAGTYISPPTSGNVFRRDVCEFLRGASYDTAVDGVILLAAPFFGDIVSVRHPLGCYRIHGKNKSGVRNNPSIALLEKHKRRFKDRVSHLKAILQQRNLNDAINPPEQMYFYSIYQINQDIITGRGIKLRQALNAVIRFPSWYSPPRKAATALAIVLAVVLPNAVSVQFLNSWRFVLVRLVTSFTHIRALWAPERSAARSPLSRNSR